MGQKREATVITSTRFPCQHQLQVLGLERGELSQEEVLSVLAEYRNSGNMTQTQNTQIQQLAVDTQILYDPAVGPSARHDQQGRPDDD